MSLIVGETYQLTNSGWSPWTGPDGKIVQIEYVVQAIEYHSFINNNINNTKLINVNFKDGDLALFLNSESVPLYGKKTLNFEIFLYRNQKIVFLTSEVKFFKLIEQGTIDDN